MQKIKFTPEDEQCFLKIGHRVEDLKQIKSLSYKFRNEKSEKISFEDVLKLTDRKAVLAAISRAAFHSSGSMYLSSIDKYGGCNSNVIEKYHR